MTHMSNYGNARLAPRLFEELANFVHEFTELQLVTKEPAELAKVYFEKFPDEIRPHWTNPCDDKRHMAIWSPEKSCNNLPDLLVLGPQKTGTSALSAFLNLHPNIVPNNPSPVTFEEPQFFILPNYLKGLDWYLNFFPNKRYMILISRYCLKFKRVLIFVPQ